MNYFLGSTKHIENIRLIFSKQNANLSTSSSSSTSTRDENNLKKNSINMKLDFDHCPTSVLDKSTKDEQNQMMSYLNLVHLICL